MSFQTAWLNEFKGGWLKKGQSYSKAFCIPCNLEMNAKHDTIKKHSTRGPHIENFNN